MFKRTITYDEYGILVKRLVDMLKNDPRTKEIKTVYGISRGGLPIAIHLSHFMHWNFTNDLFYDHYEHTIVVDDIADTGITLKKCGNLYLTATIFYKQRSEIKPDFYVEETDKWIVFPWEDVNEIPNRS